MGANIPNCDKEDKLDVGRVADGKRRRVITQMCYLQEKELEDQPFPCEPDSEEEISHHQIQKNCHPSTQLRPEKAQQIQSEIQIKSKRFLGKQNFVKTKRNGYFKEYEQLELVGKGAFGKVMKVRHKITNQICAAKILGSVQVMEKYNEKILLTEMNILQELDHPNILKILQCFHETNRLVFIFQFLEMEELSKFMANNKPFSESSVAYIMKQVFQILVYLKTKSIVHRDIKENNILINPQNLQIKLIDFGVSKLLESGQALRSLTGTPKYIAPQIIEGKYGIEVDIWSSGVLLYRLISGQFPFADSNQILFENIQNLPISFNQQIWHSISSQCKDLIRMILRKNPKMRITPEKCLKSLWVRKKVQTDGDIQETKKALRKMTALQPSTPLKAIVNSYLISRFFKDNQNGHIVGVFRKLDKNNDGIISIQQLKSALQCQKYDMKEEDLEKMIKLMDLKKSGYIDYTEFLLMIVEEKQYMNVSNIEKAFHYFDEDRDGSISMSQMRHYLKQMVKDENKLQSLFAKIDGNKDGNISKEEFVRIFINHEGDY